jgi:hypothetical protein
MIGRCDGHRLQNDYPLCIFSGIERTCKRIRHVAWKIGRAFRELLWFLKVGQNRNGKGLNPFCLS